MEFGKRHDTADTTDFCPRQLVTDFSFMLQTCCGFAAGKLVWRILAFNLLSPVHTVAEKCDCRRKRRDNGDSCRIRRQSHFFATVAVSATVAIFYDKLSPKSATVWTGFYSANFSCGYWLPGTQSGVVVQVPLWQCGLLVSFVNPSLQR